MDIIRIDDPGDSRIAAYRDIRERDLVGRQGRFIAEGKVVLDVLLDSIRFRSESILLLENRLPGLSRILSKASPGLPVYVASGPVINGITGFHMHRGILAIGRRAEETTADRLLRSLPERALVVVLVGIANHDNVGAIFRNAAAFQANAVLLDRTCCDPLYRKAIRVSVGAALKVPFATFDTETTLATNLDSHGFSRLAFSPRGTEDLRHIRRTDRLALYFGSEGEGLPTELLATMKTARIPIAGDFDSLNVAATSAIALHHFTVGDL
ncbi:TrmH family RNA methyltransferase [Manganibacter manganicus]|uniref:RNA methyltransferase n=1 Tax=Manganibacter manganicus TaxID=1873176 RepID=A0A1V8RMS5_9HYPH|nr:RNA methyltransferase [Pseudaminobacter manganicus]OQM74487.1 RNA methyltransferase [Pseudaminobacter manganicus]